MAGLDDNKHDFSSRCTFTCLEIILPVTTTKYPVKGRTSGVERPAATVEGSESQQRDNVVAGANI